MLIGVVGKPNVGKSTFFKSATLAEAEIANYPFATVKPNSGVGFVKVECVCKEFDVSCNPREGYSIDGWRFVPVQMIDVAGLVPGAHEGKGMGNQFLDDLRQADVLIHVIDVSGSTNEKGEPADFGSYDPAKDIRFLEVELDMWYLGILKKGWDKFARTIQQEKGEVHKALGKQLSGLKVNDEMVEDAIKKLGLDPEKPSIWSEQELLSLATYLRKQTKPMVIACNKIDVAGAIDNFTKLKDEFTDYTLIACSSESELALKEAGKHNLIKYIPGSNRLDILDETKLNDDQKKGLMFIQKNILDNLGSTGVQDVLDFAVFKLLGYIAIFPGGVGKLQDQDGNYIPDCFLMPSGTTTLDFAYRLHSDFGDNFIKAVDVKSKMIKGKEHKLRHRDVIEIISGK